MDYQGTVLDILADQTSWLSAQNLLQEDFSRQERIGRMFQPLRVAAGLLLTLLMLQMGMGLYDRHRLSRQTLQLDKDIVQTYLGAFPDSRNVVNPRVQMARKLEQLQATQQGLDSFQRLIEKTENAINGFPSIQIDGLDFRTGQLDLKLIASDLQILDGLKQMLEKTEGLSVTIVSATNRPQGVESRLRIQGGKS